MEIVGLNALLRFAKKNAALRKALDGFAQRVRAANWKNDADRIFNEVYIFNLTKGDRTLAMVYFDGIF